MGCNMMYSNQKHMCWHLICTPTASTQPGFWDGVVVLVHALNPPLLAHINVENRKNRKQKQHK